MTMSLMVFAYSIFALRPAGKYIFLEFTPCYGLCLAWIVVGCFVACNCNMRWFLFAIQGVIHPLFFGQAVKGALIQGDSFK